MDPERRTPSGTGRAVRLLLSMGEEYVGRDPARAMECFAEAADLARAAADPAAEADALRQLGSAATSCGETTRADAALQRALELARAAGRDVDVAACLNALAFLRGRQGDPDDALVWLRESLGRTTDAPRDPVIAAVRAETLENLGALYRDRGDPQQALVYYQEALEIRRVAGDEAGIASCRNHLGTVCYRMGRFADAEVHFVAALEARRARDDRRGVASTANNLAGTCLLLGKLRESSAYFEEARALAVQLGDRRRQASILSNMGLLRSYEGRVQEAEEYLRASLEIHRERDDPMGQGHALNNMSDLAVEQGRLEDAVEYADRSLEVWTTAGRREALAKPWVNRGRALLEMDRLQEARRAAESALESAEAAESEEYRAEANALRARVLLREGRGPEAMAAARAALEASERAESPSLRVQCGTEVARQCLASGDLEGAKQELERASRLVRGLPHPYDRACIMAEQGRLLARAGSDAAGAERLRRALEEFEALGNVRWQVRTLDQLARVIARNDPAESARTRARAEELAERHGLAGILRAEAAPGAAGTAPRSGIAPAALANLIGAWRRLAEDSPLVEWVDPFFRTLQETYRAERASLEVPGRGVGADARSGPEGRWARVDRGGDGPARFVLVPGGEPGNEPGTLEVLMPSARNGEARLLIGREEPFDEPETLSIQALGGLVSLALDAPREWRARREAVPRGDGASFQGLVGSAPAMRQVFAMITRVAPSESSVLLLGESGTGKEVAARAIHDRSPRRSGPFVAINCPSIPRELIEAELFGHEKGAFTGAAVTRPGKVEIADGGTLFLDEVGDMEPATQVRLLRFLEEREFQRVGGRETRRVDVRILAATSRDLAAEVARGAFREDLYYRLNVVPLRMPSLRERPDDIAALAAHFLPEGRRLSARALEVLARHDWPGNVRELRNAVEYAATLGAGAVLDEAQLPESVRHPSGDAVTERRVGGTWDLHSGETLEARLREVEAALIRTTLEATDWNQSAAARRLGITETKVRNRMKRYGIRRPGEETGGAS